MKKQFILILMVLLMCTTYSFAQVDSAQLQRTQRQLEDDRSDVRKMDKKLDRKQRKIDRKAKRLERKQKRLERKQERRNKKVRSIDRKEEKIDRIQTNPNGTSFYYDPFRATAVNYKKA